MGTVLGAELPENHPRPEDAASTQKLGLPEEQTLPGPTLLMTCPSWLPHFQAAAVSGPGNIFKYAVINFSCLLSPALSQSECTPDKLCGDRPRAALSGRLTLGR